MTNLQNKTIEDQKNRVLMNNKFSAKLSWKRKVNLDLASRVFEYLEDQGFRLSKYDIDFRDKTPKLSETTLLEITKEVYSLDLENDFDHHARYGKYVSRFKDRAKSFEQYTEDQYQKRIAEKRQAIKREMKHNTLSKELEYLTDPETGECLYDEYAELAKMAYTLKKFNKACYAIFQNGKSYMQQFIAAWYSKHRMDEVWNWRKSQLIRRLWREFLLETKLYEEYKPMHLMLTVPHTKDGWKGKQFYGAELIEKFNFMRKRPEWKKYIYGGEYGLEVTRKGNSGLHIHLHCLVFQRKGYSVNEVRDWIYKQWHNLTEAKIMHYESLYIYRKDPKTGHYYRNKETGNKIKFYLDQSDSWYRTLKGEDKLKAYVNGVMECIKYHFKNDNFRDEEGNWDIELIKDILNQSKNLRFYSKFGAFYTEKRLNYSRIENEPEEENVMDAEDHDFEGEEMENDDLNGSTDGVEENLLNPYTLKPAKKHEYIRVLSTPEFIRHMPKDSGYQPIVSNSDHNHFYAIRNDMDLKEIMKNIGRGSFNMVLAAPDYERFMNQLST